MNAPKYLQEILDYKKNEINDFKINHSYSEFEKKIKDFPFRDFENSLKTSPISIIAEIKKASPSMGTICENFDPMQIAKTYDEIGVNAISVLTDRKFFGGHVDILKQVRDVTNLPLLRKDFILDEIQVLEAKAAGADACLLIVSALSDKRLCELIHISNDLNISPLVEVHTKDEVKRAVDAGARIIGINNRNLETFEINLNTSKEIVAEIPKYFIKVSESGIENKEHVDFIRSLEFDACLIGTSFMKSSDKKMFLKELME